MRQVRSGVLFWDIHCHDSNNNIICAIDFNIQSNKKLNCLLFYTYSYKEQQMQTTLESQLFNLPCQQFFSGVASNPELLSKGYEIVYRYLSMSAGNRQNTLLHLLSQKAPVMTLVTRTYPIVYADQTIGITNEERTATRQYLILEILFKKLILGFGKQSYANKKNLSNFLIFLVHFHNNEGFEGWVACYQKLLQQLIRIDSQLIGLVLIQILKNSDDRVSCFSRHILPFIINNQASLKMSEEQSLQILYYCIKSMAYLNGTDDQVLEQYFQPFEQKITSYIFVSMQKSVKIMKFSLKILTVFAADYQIQLQKQMIQKIRQCAKQLVVQNLNNRIKQNSKEDFEEDDLQDQNNTNISVVLYQIIELFQTLLSVQQMKMADYGIYLAISLPCLLLSRGQYMDYNKTTEVYLADIGDQAQRNLRNKVVSFLLELYQGEYPSKIKGKMQAQVLNYVLLIQARVESEKKFGQQIMNFFSNLSLPINIQKQHITLFQQSLTFLLYHLTQEILTFDTKNLEQNKQSLMMNLGKNIETSFNSNDHLIKVAYLNLLNKMVKSMSKGVRQAYYCFLVQQMSKVQDYQKQTGFVLSVSRGIAYVSTDIQIQICDKNNQKGVSVLMLQNLIKYLLDTDTLQQSVYLILQFFLTLLKKVNNAKNILKILFPSQIQIHILSTYIHDGMIADVVIDLLGQISSQEFVSYIYAEFMKGNAKQENLAVLIARWVKLSVIQPAQNEIVSLLRVYKNAFIQKIIKQYLGVVQRNGSASSLSAETISMLNLGIYPNWVLPMIGCNILSNPQTLLINTIQNITHQLTSQYEIQSQLLLPYYTFINDPNYGVSILCAKSVQLYEAFFTKLIRYAPLFQGPRLKVITSIVLLNICEVDHSKIQPVIELISSYGNSTQGQDWQDQNQKDSQTNVIDRMFNMKITNDQIQGQFAQIFGNKTTDMELVNAKVTKMISLIQ